jgi:hypothetical protein
MLRVFYFHCLFGNWHKYRVFIKLSALLAENIKSNIYPLRVGEEGRWKKSENIRREHRESSRFLLIEMSGFPSSFVKIVCYLEETFLFQNGLRR